MHNKDSDYNNILALITHDLKSPLTAVFGAFELLSEDDLTDEEKTQLLKSGMKASKSIMKLIDNILTMSKMEAGKNVIEYKNIDNLYEEISSIQKTFKYEIKMKNINFSVDIEDDLPLVSCDFDALHYHVLNNLISNAIKFTPSGGNIKFSVKAKENNIIIVIKDDGIGIEKKKRKTIFDKYDTHNNQKVFKGTGLGLYNAHYFITQHKGTIEAIKGIKEKGIGFKIVLPIVVNPLVSLKSNIHD